MVSVFRSIFRVVLILIFMFITLKTLGIFPHEAEAAIRYRSFISRSDGGSYRSIYGGRYIYRGFGSSSNSRRKLDENLQEGDQKRLYYEKKMAEWREKNKELLSNRTGDGDGDGDSDSESKVGDKVDNEGHAGQLGGGGVAELRKAEAIENILNHYQDDPDFEDTDDTNSQYDYENYVDHTTTTTTTQQSSVNLTNLTGNSTTPSPLSSSTARIVVLTSTSTDRVEKIMAVKPPRKSYGYRYGRVKVEKL